jgi:hypothetical protein
MTDIKISGTIGLKILHNTSLNKKIFIFYDDHSNTKYCNKNKSQLFISELFNNISNNDIAMILEEPFLEPDSKIKVLWDDSTHLFLFRKFYAKLIKRCSNEKICKIFPIDIRLTIFDVSPDEIIFNLNEPSDYYNISLKTYFENIFYLFELNNYIPKPHSLIAFIKKVLDVYKKSKFYKILKKRIIEFNNKYDILNSTKTIYEMLRDNHNKTNFIYEEGFPFINNHNHNFIDQLDKISSGIMELYTLILIFLLPNKNVVLYAGYYHSNNISYILKTYYNFKELYVVGTTDNIDNYMQIENCITVNTEFLNFI